MQTFNERLYIYNFKTTFHVFLSAVALSVYSPTSNLPEEVFPPHHPYLAPRKHLVVLCVAVRLAAYGMTEN